MSSLLSEYFIGVGVKRLSQVEVAPDLSNQHELNGIGDFRNLFGTDKRRFEAKYILISDNEELTRTEDGMLTWYDAREKHPTRTEFRLYYSENEIISTAKAGDLVVVAQIDENHLAVIIATEGSTSEQQLLWLFGLENAGNKFVVKDLTTDKNDLGFAGRFILSSLGFENENVHNNWLEEILVQFGSTFPSTREFSKFARSTVKHVSPIEAPDETLITWLEREELLFKTLEKVIIKESLQKGFGKDGTDVDEFIRFSLSVQNRRKARAGLSFENNLAVIFNENYLQYSHGALTERNNKPDFIFPGSLYYHDPLFDSNLLTMLGLKTTAKDRWRQVLSEAEKIPNKHLITLEPAISFNQTEEMKANKLQLVIPAPLFKTYSTKQQKELINLKEFIDFVKDQQFKSGTNKLLF
ncbi:MAG: type II restriction endonuclease [Bacteroidia bacterium]